MLQTVGICMFGPPQYCEGHEKERETNLSVPNNFTCVHMYIMYNNVYICGNPVLNFQKTAIKIKHHELPSKFGGVCPLV